MFRALSTTYLLEKIVKFFFVKERICSITMNAINCETAMQLNLSSIIPSKVTDKTINGFRLKITSQLNFEEKKKQFKKIYYIYYCAKFKNNWSKNSRKLYTE